MTPPFTLHAMPPVCPSCGVQPRFRIWPEGIIQMSGSVGADCVQCRATYDGVLALLRFRSVHGPS